jgi:hypothetical protein
MLGTSGAGTGAAGTGAGAASVLVVLAFEDELGEACESGVSGPSIIMVMMRHAIKVFEI